MMKDFKHILDVMIDDTTVSESADAYIEALTQRALQSMMLQIILKNSTREEREYFIDTVLKKMKRVILNNYDGLGECSPNIQELMILGREDFTLDMNNRIVKVGEKLRRLLI